MCSYHLGPLALFLLALAGSNHFILLTNQRSISISPSGALSPAPPPQTPPADEPPPPPPPVGDPLSSPLSPPSSPPSSPRRSLPSSPPAPPSISISPSVALSLAPSSQTPPWSNSSSSIPSSPQSNSTSSIPSSPQRNSSSSIPSSPQSSPPSSQPIGVIVGVVIGSVVVILIVGLCTFFIWRKKRRGSQSAQPQPQPPKADQFGGPTNGGASSHNVSSPAINMGLSQSLFTYEELAYATNGFSDSNFLGQGGFGYVHKGVLPNGKTVAIKQLKAGSRQGEREFQAEVEVISRVHHRHLVSLVGYYIGGSQRMLVYEFVPNNTLEFHLHGKDGKTMDWATRIKIAIGSAKGLAYLHEDCHPKIIHRDIKASNILLDDNFEAKVADFGLAKFSSDVDTHVSTRIMGTFGYLAPEYAASGKLTEKSDVFSYGVVLLELITGRKPVDKTESFIDASMVEQARPLLSQAMGDGNFDALADPRLQKSYNSDEMLRMITCAANCVRHSARQRPRMSQVVRALEGNISLDDLNEGGSTPGRSRAFSSFESTSYDTGQYNKDLKKFRKLALDQETSEYSGPSSEYGQHQSTSSSSGLQNA